jgi:hypothetical protein
MIASIEATSTPIVSQSISRQPSHLYRSRHDPRCNRRQGNCLGQVCLLEIASVSDVNLLCDLDCVIDLKVPRATVDQDRLSAPQ